MMRFFKPAGIAFLSVGVFMLSATSFAANVSSKNQYTAVPHGAPVFLQLEFTSSCTEKGAVFKIVNHGEKWPKRAALRLYLSDTKSIIGERKMRLGQGQKVSFVVKDTIAKGHPVAVWVEPDWYKRDFKFDANINCN